MTCKISIMTKSPIKNSVHGLTIMHIWYKYGKCTVSMRLSVQSVSKHVDVKHGDGLNTEDEHFSLKDKRSPSGKCSPLVFSSPPCFTSTCLETLCTLYSIVLGSFSDLKNATYMRRYVYLCIYHIW